MAIRLNIGNRKIDYWATVLVALPTLTIIGLRLLLPMKKAWTWVHAGAEWHGTAPVRAGMRSFAPYRRTRPARNRVGRRGSRSSRRCARPSRRHRRPRAHPHLPGEDWHRGVIGLTAGRIAQRYYHPTFVMPIEGD